MDFLKRNSRRKKYPNSLPEAAGITKRLRMAQRKAKLRKK